MKTNRIAEQMRMMKLGWKKKFVRILAWALIGCILPFELPARGAGAGEKRMASFLDRLIARMTLEEKAGQLTQYSADMAVTGSTLKENFREDVAAGRVGSIFNAFTPRATREMQKLAVERSRLKIPLLFGFDVIHGHKTIFPIPLAESCSWDLARMEASARTAGREAAADGIHWTFAPMVDVTRDPRWGRVMEGAGEDPWLGSQVAAARVRGFQGPVPGSTDAVMACVKHFAAYGAPIAGRDYNSVELSERTLREEYLPPYRAAVEAGAATVMTAFNDIAGVPSTANAWLLTRVLREEWKFSGFVVTDYTAVNELVPHGLAADEKQAARLAFNAGADMDMQGGSYARYLPALVRGGQVKRARLDRAVRRVLEAKYKLGLFDDPYRFSNEKRAAASILTPENLQQARDMARHSIVLLKNEGPVLPLKKTGTVALIGPYAEEHRNLLGAWSAAASDGFKAVSLAEGLARVGGADVKILRALGANLLDNGLLRERFRQFQVEMLPVDPRPDEALVKEALLVARQADVVVLALGEASAMSGEASSRTSLRLPENQVALLRALKEGAGKPIVLVLFGGRPLVLGEESELASSLVEAWFPGTEGGDGIADVLFGDYNPSGKLTMSFPVNEGQIPIYYSQRSTGRPVQGNEKYSSRYLDAPNEPLFPFGFGLSYTSFTYSKPRLDRPQLRANEPLHLRVTVTNSGKVDGEEVTQLYLGMGASSVTQPLKRLRGFQKVFLHAGQSRELVFSLGVEDLKFYNLSLKRAAEPGLFTLMVGGNSRDLQKISFRYGENTAP